MKMNGKFLVTIGQTKSRVDSQEDVVTLISTLSELVGYTCTKKQSVNVRSDLRETPEAKVVGSFFESLVIVNEGYGRRPLVIRQRIEARDT